MFVTAKVTLEVYFSLEFSNTLLALEWSLFLLFLEAVTSTCYMLAIFATCIALDVAELALVLEILRGSLLPFRAKLLELQGDCLLFANALNFSLFSARDRRK